ncbi:hypothetical protein DM860_004315 [Cuscuta australis]|uniref:DUF4005 domain-containing protein n=1 Tax=Cuscuta australis TaxID=267555 RepID=A0A328E780_9ASTE|nr:hypothetical protein DM860_004315 [Cuscuta australis]
MAKKKRSWCNVLKRLILLRREATLEKGKRKRPFGRLKIKWSSLFSTPPQPQPQTGHEEGEEDQQQKNCVAVTAEPAETPQQYSYSYDRQILNLASIKIQTAFRGFLARKALRALKGLVRLQAIIRGRAVRRQTIDTLKRLQSIVSIQSELHAQSCNLVKNTADLQEKQYQDIKIDMNSHRGWDNRILSKEEANAMFLSKMDAAIKRERIREYWLTHKRSSEGEWRPQIKQRYWLEQWVDAQLAKREDLVNLDTDICAGARMRNEFEQRESKTISLKQYRCEGTPRRSFQHKRQHSIGDDSPRVSRSVPTYMAATESAKAKARSLSSPRMRPMKFDAYSDINSPYKYKLSPISSINSEMTVKSKVLNPSSLSQRSPCLKSIAAPVRSSRSLKNVRLESDF